MLKPIYTIDQIANFLISTYWMSIFGEHTGPEQPHHFATNTITYNISTLTPQGQLFARAALQAWSDVCNVTFVEVSGTAQIKFTDDQPGAFSGYTATNGVTTSAYVNVSKAEFTDTIFGSPTFNAFLHEIGHTLGLGHAGPYAGLSSYSADTAGGGNNIYLNDTQAYSVMSYFGGGEFDSSNRQGSTPRIADIAAVTLLYGTAHSTRIGNTVYGFDCNAGVLYDFTQYALQYSNYFTGPPSLTIYDSGGNDTLNCSGYSIDQKIDLTPGSFLSVGGLLNNISIDLHTVIENVIGGAGNDQIKGNAYANVATGGLGDDTIDGGTGVDVAVFSGTRANYTITTIAPTKYEVSGPDGHDTLLNIDRLRFSDQFVDVTPLGQASTAYSGVLRATLPDANANSIEAVIGTAQLSLASYVSQLIEQAKDSTIPALIVPQFIEGATPTSARLDALAAFCVVQHAYYTQMGVGNPDLGPYEALGMGFAETSQFAQMFGTLNDTAFITTNYSDAFGRAPTMAQISHFQRQIDYFSNLYTGVGIATDIAHVRAKGAALGQMLGFAAEETENDYVDAATGFLLDASDGTVVYGTSLMQWV
jgi:Ca2+-binding RTX toxin-like protein